MLPCSSEAAWHCDYDCDGDFDFDFDSRMKLQIRLTVWDSDTVRWQAVVIVERDEVEVAAAGLLLKILKWACLAEEMMSGVGGEVVMPAETVCWQSRGKQVRRLPSCCCCCCLKENDGWP